MNEAPLYAVKNRPKTLRFLDLSLPEPEANLRLDEELLAAGEGVLRVWEMPRECVVMGQSGRAEREVWPAEGVPVLRRSSGGGTVVLGPGCLNYSLVVPLAWEPLWRDVAASMCGVMERMVAALGVPGLRVAGLSDLALDGRKVSGNAQRRAREAFLHHGTLLYGFDAARAERLLRMPARQPAYRAGRGHEAFLGNLPLGAEEIKARLRAEWC